ncbi:RNA-directed DNA polymerase from mobile element jockey-like [Plakobranchus ocellatus]|uniref:RNA-directed DNA polymerase from mobile element jockey-like n=1 Tax=Plakobranchus ocellatus TaxID=259542 RepID=A0AAV4C431_9GAST|nr:RNA-directed DNA polymerase from mobile element jockey-like [Plakobranchus ocellatus]
MGLSLNVKKTECMVVSKKSSNPKCNLVSKGKQIKQITKFKYPGYLITSDGRYTSEISERVAMAKDIFQKMKTILANRNISMTTKIRAEMVAALVTSCTTFSPLQNVATAAASTDTAIELQPRLVPKRVLKLQHLL